MRILADENIPRRTVETLRGLGHDVKDIRGTPQQGMSDEQIWTLACREGRLLISTDRGFARRRAENHRGVLLVCLSRPNRQRIHDRVMGALAEISEGEWPGAVVIVRDRVRSLWRRA